MHLLLPHQTLNAQNASASALPVMRMQYICMPVLMCVCVYVNFEENLSVHPVYMQVLTCVCVYNEKEPPLAAL